MKTQENHELPNIMHRHVISDRFVQMTHKMIVLYQFCENNENKQINKTRGQRPNE